MMTNLMWKFFSLSDCWRPVILAACVSVLALAIIFLGALINGTHFSVLILTSGVVFFIVQLPMVFYHMARVQSKSENQIRALQHRIEQLESQSVRQIA